MIATELNRRDFLKTTGLLATAAFLPTQLIGCGDGADVNNDWETRATELEALTEVRTEANPGPWSEKVGGHLPAVEFDMDNTNVTVRTSHGMSEDHYITTIYIRDQNGVVVGLKELNPTDSEAAADFTLPEGTTAITAYSYCNLHDHWMTESVTI